MCINQSIVSMHEILKGQQPNLAVKNQTTKYKEKLTLLLTK